MTARIDRLAKWLLSVTQGAVWHVGLRVAAAWRAVRHGRGTAAPLMAAFVPELPDLLEAHLVYVAGEGEHLWFAAMLCPCGCGETLHMSLHREGRPNWRLTKHWDGTVSLLPSVWRRVGCRSHFFLRRGRVEWCRSAKSSA